MAETIMDLANDAAMVKRRRAASDPVRMRIMGFLHEGLTAKELAARLRMEPNRLYHHLRVLEDAGIVAVVDHRVVDRGAERVYKVVYEGRYRWDFKAPEDLAMNLGAILEITRADAELALYEQADRERDGRELATVAWGRPSFRTTRPELKLFAEKVQELQMEFRQRAKDLEVDDAELHTLAFTFVVYEESEIA